MARGGTLELLDGGRVMRVFRAFPWATATVAVACLACGGEEPKTIVAPMTAEPAATSSASNRPPSIESVRLDPASPIFGERVQALVKARDPDGDAVQLSYVWHVAGRRLDTGESAITLPNVKRGQTIRVSARASDGKLHSDSVVVEARVRNQRPVLLGVGVRPEPEVLPGEMVVAIAQARDPDGDALEYEFRWRVNGKQVASREPKLDTVGLKKGDEISVSVLASDGSMESNEIDSVVRSLVAAGQD